MIVFQRFLTTACKVFLFLILTSCNFEQVRSLVDPQKTSTPSPEPVVLSSPVSSPLKVINTWMRRSVVSPRLLTYAVMLYNPDNTYPLENATIRSTIYDVNGSQIHTHEEGLMMIWPGSKVPIVETVELPEGASPQRIDVKVVNPGSPVTTSPKDYPFKVNDVTFSPWSSVPAVSGEVVSSFDRDIYHTRFTAIAYAPGGTILGAGFITGRYLPAGGTVAVNIPLNLPSLPEKVELYFTPDLNSTTNPPGSSRLDVERVDLISVSGSSAAAAFVLKNSDPLIPIVRSYYVASIYDDAGIVLASCPGVVDGVIFPEQRLGLGCSMDIPPGKIAARVSVQTLVDPSQSLAENVVENPLVASQVVFSSTAAHAVIKNLWPSELKNISMHVVGYNKSGSIVAFGNFRLKRIPANAEAAVEVQYAAASGSPVRGEVFAVPDQFSFGE